MFQGFIMVPLHFTVEFLGFLVAAGACLLAMTRPTLIPGSAFNRLSAALGFGVLAAAQVLHGGAFDVFGSAPEVQFGFDGSQYGVALRALAFAFILIGVGGAKETPAPAAAAAFSLKEPLLLAPAGAALLMALLSFVGASRGAPKALRRLGLAGLFFAASEALTAAAPRVTFGTGTVDQFALIAHGVKALGFLAVGSWLWAGVRSSIRTRFVASFVALLILVVLVLSSALTGVISNNVEESEFERVSAQAANAIQTIEDEEVVEVKNRAEEVADIDQTRVALTTELSEGEIAQGYFAEDSFKEDFLVFTDPRGDLRAVAGRGPQVNLSRAPAELRPLQVLNIIGSDVVQDLIENDVPSAVGVDDIDDRSVAIIAATRVRECLPGIDDCPVSTSQTVGLAIVGRYVDALTVEGIAARLDIGTTLIVDRKVLATTLPSKPSFRELLPPEAFTELQTAGVATAQQTFGARSYYSSYQFIETPGGAPVAILGLSSPASLAAENREGVTQILFGVAMGVAVIALILAFLSGRRITRPIQALTQAASAVREGNLQIQAEVSGEDEVGQLGETFNEMTSSLYRMTRDLRQAAREEHALRTRIETIIQSMDDGLVAVDADLKVLAFNSQAELLTGIKAKNAVGRTIEKVLDARDSQGEPMPLPIYGLAPGSVGGVFLHRKRGERVPVTVLCAVLRTETEEIDGGVAVLRDMTREREVERMKSEFLSNISHELRTPLTPIKGYAEIMQRKDIPPDKVQKFVKGILESTGRLERIVELLVDFSAMEAGRLSPRAAPLDLGSLVEKLAEDWKKRTTLHTVVTDVKSRLPKVIGDERLIRRSLEEIIDNAVKFSPKGGTIRLEVRSGVSQNGAADRRRAAVHVSVSDEGIGISEQDLPKIFSDFQQLDGSQTRSYGGLGLGLAFVQRIVEAHEGSVIVDSAPDKGTKLTIAIPAVKSRRTPPDGVRTTKK